MRVRYHGELFTSSWLPCSNRKKSEKQRESKVSQGGAVRGGRGGGVRGGRGGGQQMDAEALRRMEAEELSKMQYGNMATQVILWSCDCHVICYSPRPQVEMGGEEMYMEVPPTVHHPHTFTPPHPHYEVEPPSHYYPPRPRNPRDDRLVMNKHGSICPLDSEVGSAPLPCPPATPTSLSDEGS